jgi:hypothetical protein
MDRPSLLRQFCPADCSTFPLHRAFIQVMHLDFRYDFSQREGSANRARESRARHAICITMRRVNKIRHVAHKKMRAPHCDARSVTWMSRFLGPRCAFITSKKMMKASRNYRAESGGTGRCSGPVYQESGRISRLSAPCSITCADQPVMRDATKIGVKSGISKPIR